MPINSPSALLKDLYGTDVAGFGNDFQTNSVSFEVSKKIKREFLEIKNTEQVREFLKEFLEKNPDFSYSDFKIKKLDSNFDSLKIMNNTLNTLFYQLYLINVYNNHNKVTNKLSSTNDFKKKKSLYKDLEKSESIILESFPHREGVKEEILELVNIFNNMKEKRYFDINKLPKHAVMHFNVDKRKLFPILTHIFAFLLTISKISDLDEKEVEDIIFLENKSFVIFIDILLDKGYDKDIIEIIIKGILLIRNFFRKMFNFGNGLSIDYTVVVKDIDKVKLYLDAFIKMYDLEKINIELTRKLEFFLISLELGVIGIKDFFEINKVDVDITKKMFDLGLFEHIRDIDSSDNRNYYLFILYNQYNIFLKQTKLVYYINDDNIRYIYDLSKKDISNDFFVYILENNLFDIDLDKINLLDFYFQNNFSAYISKLSLLDISNLNELKSRNIKITDKILDKLLYGLNLDDVLRQDKILEFKEDIENRLLNIKGIKNLDFGKIDRLLGSLNNDVSEKEFNKIKANILKIYDNNFKSFIEKYKKISANGLNNEQITSYVNILLSKKNKSNGLTISNILDIILKLSDNYNSFDIDIFLKLIENKKIIIKDIFLNNYEKYISIFMKYLNFVDIVLEQVNQNISLAEFIEKLSNQFDIEIRVDIIQQYFPESLIDAFFEISSQSKLDKFISISKWVDNKKDEDFFLELLTMEDNEFQRFYFLLKNLHILGFGLQESYKSIFEYVKNGFFSENKLKELKPYTKKFFNISLDKQSFLFSLLLDYISGESNIDPIEQYFNIEESEKIEDEEFVKNTGISGLAGWKGQDIIKKFEKLGFEIKRVNGKNQGKGDHILMYKKVNNGTLYTMIPNHNPVKAKTLFDTLNRAKISKEDFLNI